jgi:hypothetical protein
VLPHSSEVFNNGIYSLVLREIFMYGGIYTWSKYQRNPTLETLDRVLMSSDWDDLFLLVTITKVVKDQSDHSFT